MMQHMLQFVWNDSDALAPLVISSALRGTAVLLCAIVAAVLARRSSAAVRHMVWMLGLVSALAIPVLSAALPSWKILPPMTSIQGKDMVAMPVEFPAPIRETARPPHTGLAPDHLERKAEAPGGAPAPDRTVWSISATADEPSRHSILAWIALVWFGGALVALGPLVASWCVLFRLARHVRPADQTLWQSLLKEPSAALKLHRTPLLLACEAPIMPMTWGVLCPKILLPVDYKNWSNARRRVVLLHELAHVKRMDCLSGLIARAACAIYWFNPIAWVALIRMRDLRERACDDMALAAGSDAPSYAQHLLAIVASTCRPPSGGIAMARSSVISGRLEALLDLQTSRSQVTARRATMMTAVAMVVAIPLAMLRAGEPGAAAPAPSRAVAGIEGDVAEVDGKPLAGADVEIVLIRYVENTLTVQGADIFARTKSDARGRFQLPQPPPASRTLRSDFIRATLPGRAYQYALLRKQNGQLVVFDSSRHQETDHPSLILPPEAHVSGGVVDDQGNPIAGAQVTHRSDDVVSTDAQGRFHFDKVSPSRYGVYWAFNSLTVTHPDYVNKHVRMDDIVAGRDNSARVVLERGVVQRGTLSDADTGKPLRGFLVQAEFEPRQETQFVGYSDANGRYELRVPKSRVTLRPGVALGFGASDSNYYPVVDAREVRAADTDALQDVNFTFRHGRSISGKVVGIPDVSVLYLEARPAEADPNWQTIVTGRPSDPTARFTSPSSSRAAMTCW
jgi:beta-lactamase regulating signal transducer with metallopeptidase domain